MALLPVHIIAGSFGITSGFIALYTLKGAKLPRKCGMVFVYTMPVVAITGTVVGTLTSGMAAIVPGVRTYLGVTALLTVLHPIPKFNWLDAT